MKKHFRRIAIACIGLLAGLLHHCASVTAPTGGGRDTTPPQLIVDQSTPNLQTNFSKQPIVLTFDEWVELQDVYNQVVVSPPIEGSPDIRIRKKSIIFEFPEEAVLRDSATYTINFGTAVQDITERNPAENLRFVFSTGSYIDSLELEVEVVDAYTGEGQDGVLVMLFDQLQDSVVYRELPFYFTFTDKNGRARLSNLREGEFKLFALKDSGKKYLYEGVDEPMAFREEPLAVTDSTRPMVLLMSTPTGPLRLKEYNTDTYGRADLTFSYRPPDLELYSPMDRAPRYVQEWQGDTSLRLWYDADTLSEWNLLLRSDTTFRDSLSIRISGREEFFESAALQITTRSTQEGDLNPLRPLWIEFNHPLADIDTSLMQLLEDTTLRPVKPLISRDSLNPRRLNIQFGWKEGTTYRLLLPPPAVTDLYGLQPADSLSINFVTDLLKNYGTYQFSFRNIPADTSYYISLMRQGEETVGFSVDTARAGDRELSALPVGEYQLRIITDLNKNQDWDPGDYAARRQPEAIVTRTLKTLRANWIVEVLVDFNDLTAESPDEE